MSVCLSACLSVYANWVAASMRPKKEKLKRLSRGNLTQEKLRANASAHEQTINNNSVWKTQKHTKTISNNSVQKSIQKTISNNSVQKTDVSVTDGKEKG